MTMNLGLDKRYILYYLLSLVICGVLVFYFFFFQQKTSVPVLDPNPVTVSVPAGTMFHRLPSCPEHSELGKLPKSAKAQILALSTETHNVLVQTTDNGRRGWLKKEVFKEGVIPEDHPFPGFYDNKGYRFSSSLKDFQGKRLEELEKEYGTAISVMPDKKKGSFEARFRMELYNKEDHVTYTDPAFRFVDSLATEIILPEQYAKKWSWSQYSPLFRLPIWLGYKVTPKQYTGSTVTMLDSTHGKSVNIWFKFKPDWLRIICNILLVIVYLAFIIFVFIRIPLYAVYPLPIYLKYNYNLSASATNGLLGIIFFLVYLLMAPFIAMDLATSSIWNLIWTVLLLGGGIWVYGKWSADIEENKCVRCNRYKSYECTRHEYSHTTIEQRTVVTTSHETRSGTVDGHHVTVDVPVEHTDTYKVEVKHFNDTFTCRYCGREYHSTSTEETRL